MQAYKCLYSIMRMLLSIRMFIANKPISFPCFMIYNNAVSRLLRLALLPSGESWNLVSSCSTIDCQEVVALVPRFHPPQLLSFVNLLRKLLRQLPLLKVAM